VRSEDPRCPATNRVSIIAVGWLFGSALLYGCGVPDGRSHFAGSEYCGLARSFASTAKDLSSSANPDFAKLDQLVTLTHKMTDVAPARLKDDFKVVRAALDALAKAVHDAGFTFDTLGDLLSAASAGQQPPGVDANTLRELSNKFLEFTSERTSKASDEIDAYDKEIC
jgi:hypothetical protein